VWKVRQPDGGFLDTSQSRSQGLQEAIFYAAEHGHDLRVYGGGIARKNGQDVAIISSTQRIYVPPIQGVDWHIHATINFGGDLPAHAAVNFDSIMASTIMWTGQIVCASGWGAGVLFCPQSELPQDLRARACITANRIWLPSVIKVDGTCISLDASYGAITGNEFYFMEPNGGNVGVALEAGFMTTIDHNAFLIRECHGQVTGIRCGKEGQTIPNANIFGNTWNAATMPTSIGFEIFCRNSAWTISIDNREGYPDCGFTLNPGASHNVITVLMNDAQMKMNNASGNATNVITPTQE